MGYGNLASPSTGSTTEVTMLTIPEALAIGWTSFHAGDFPRAERVSRQVLEVHPSAARVWYLLGTISHVQGQLGEAVAHYERALGLEPHFVEVLNNLAVTLLSLRKVDESAAYLRRALQFQPDYADAHSNLGNALQADGKLDEAEACYRHALQLKPDNPNTHHDLGNALRASGRLAEAMACYDQALRLKPDFAQVHLSRSLLRLQMGDFEQGWSEYEWRFQCTEYAIPRFRQPLWDGSRLDDQTILLYADHGLGDTLQFIRYARVVQERGGRVLVACRQPLARILASCPGVARVIPEGAILPEFQVYAPMMSLPRMLGTTLANVPARVPYLAADPALVTRWHAELRQSGGFKVGIAWQGNAQYCKDRHRSFRLDQFEPLSRLDGVRLVSLQKGLGTEQIGEVADRFSVIDLGSRFDDFMDCAAVLSNLDLVITPDTSVAHLAGALGVPVWVALPFAPDWRWLLDREDSPWYPTMRLFRQRDWGDWNEVFQRMSRDLGAKLHTSR
jgi:Tfp pilus assembly protein PilF